jgi:hypothetical protein
MRRIYILRANEEDGRLLDALTAAGCSPDESTLENPVCPRCGSSTLLAFTEDDQFQVLLWEKVDDTDGAGAHAWHLICSRFDCAYQEEVERVLDPMGAEIFDQWWASAEFEEYAGLMERHPIELMDLIEYFRAVLATGQNPKLACMLEEAEWRYEASLEWRWKWIRSVPLGKRIRFTLIVEGEEDEIDETDEIEGTFVTPTDDGFMVLRDPDETCMLVQARDIGRFQPQRPKTQELPKPRKQEIAEVLSADERGNEARRRRVIYNMSPNHWVVIRGHHLMLSDVNRLGQYKVRCWDPAAAEALSLTPHGERYWEGLFRRSEIEGRYDLKIMIKAKGHWVDMVGYMGEQKWPYVRTEDPAVAADLGLTEQVPLYPPKTEEELRRYQRSWSGGVPENDIEDRQEVKLYHWPLPEFKVR